MSSDRLVSTVFVLKYAKRFSTDKRYFGRAAHKIALGLIQQVSRDLASEIHNADGILPLTVSDLFQSDKDFHWMRLTGLREDVVNALLELSQLKDINFDGWRVHYALTEMHDWSGESSAEELVAQHWQESKQIHLQFETATAIKSKGLYRPLPYADLIFKSLFERWQALIETELPYCPEREVLEVFLNYGVSIRDYRIQAHQVAMKNSSIQAFSGRVQFHIENPSRALKRAAKRDATAQTALEHYGELTRLVNLLAEFSFYSGAGIKTAQGMGMMKRV